MLIIACPILIVLALAGALVYLERRRPPHLPNLEPVRVRRDDQPRPSK